MFNDKIQRKCPNVDKMLKEFHISTEAFILDWMFTVYSRSFNLKLARVFWDIFLLFGEYYVIRVAYAIFATLKKELANKANMENGLKFIRAQTGQLKLSNLVKITLREAKTAQEIEKIYADIRAKQRKNTA